MVKNALVGFCAFCAFCGGSEKLGQGPGVMGDRPDLPLLALTDYLSVFMFLVFFVAAIRLEARGKRSEVRGERLEVIGPIRISVSRFLLSPVSSFPPSPLRVTSRPSRLKMDWFVFVFLVFFVAVLRLGARGERLEAAPLLTAVNPVFVLSSRHWAKQRRMRG